MQNIFVFGHRNPDTDSVCAAISLSYLKNRMGFKTVPKVIGHINHETKYVLDYFHVLEPGYLNDVKIQIKNMNYNKKAMVLDTMSIYGTYHFMEIEGLSGVPIIDTEKHILGLITLKEISKSLIHGNIDYLHTSYNNLLEALHAKEVLRFDEEIEGHILAASYKSETFVSEISLQKDDILIVGDRYKILEHAVHSGVKLIILVGNHEMPLELLEIARKNKVNVIVTEDNTYHTANFIKLSNYVGDIIVARDPITFDLHDYRNDFIDTVSKVGHTNYPIVNRKGECVGMIKATSSNSYEKAKVILVDHNQASQSAEGIEDAEIVEVIDHHNLGTIGTSTPINFRSMPVGCTCTVIYSLFLEQRIEIPRDIAGLMLSAIISDTLLLQSPTTTKYDIDAAEHLSVLAGVDYKEYGKNMLRAGSSIQGMSFEEVFYQDFKTYKVEHGTIGISQIITMDFDEIKKDIHKYVDLLNTISYQTYQIAVMFVTDVVRNGSYVIYNSDAEDYIREAYHISNIEEGSYIPGLVSRKKQMLPKLMEVLEKRG